MMDGGFNFRKEEDQGEEQEEEEQFFDARDDISSVSESCPCSPYQQSRWARELLCCVSRDLQYGVWVGNLDSVEERRQRFMRWMRSNCLCSPRPESTDLGIAKEDESMAENERIMLDSLAMLRSFELENGTSTSSWSSDASCSSENGSSEVNCHCRIKNLDDGTVFIVDKLGQDGTLSRLPEVGSNQTVTIDEFHQSLDPSSFVEQFMHREDNLSTSSGQTVGRRRMGWLKRLGVAACIVDRQEEEDHTVTFADAEHSFKDTVHRVKARPYRKHSKEFSAVYKGQDIKAHNGAILTMKFSPDGRYLATGGEDGVVRVWHVIACERTYEVDIPKDDPSCIYFTVSQNSEITPIHTHKENKSKSQGAKRTPDSACVVIPTEVFRISEKPLHEFFGHTGDVLDLSWSNNNYLLSSSTDKTSRLWQVGCDSFGKVFSHNNYVTCVQFNPIDENYFISGSIDGKVRIWEISGHRVVNWIDAREIVTAVCYRSDGKGLVVGTIDGHCLFYDSSDNHLQLETEVLLHGKKKSASNRITGFQFFPGDPQKLMITSADSQVRIMDGIDVICKYKGLRNTGSQISASFTTDGRYIISASEDSNVYIWNYIDQGRSRPHHVKSIWSHERILSENVSVAIPWHGLESGNPLAVTSQVLASQKEVFRDLTAITGNDICCPSELLGNNSLHLSSSGSFTLGQSFFSEFLPKGSATWPEEKLPSRSLTAALALHRSQCRLLKSSCQKVATSPHAWGRVIVTAGLDGRIRSFHNYGLPVHT